MQPRGPTSTGIPDLESQMESGILFKTEIQNLNVGN